jgi:hypothetical protein
MKCLHFVLAGWLLSSVSPVAWGLELYDSTAAAMHGSHDGLTYGDGCQNCGGLVAGCCARPWSKYDHVWDGYCAEKHHGLGWDDRGCDSAWCHGGPVCSGDPACAAPACGSPACARPTGRGWNLKAIFALGRRGYGSCGGDSCTSGQASEYPQASEHRGAADAPPPPAIPSELDAPQPPSESRLSDPQTRKPSRPWRPRL